jgi:hypothetical protein
LQREVYHFRFLFAIRGNTLAQGANGGLWTVATAAQNWRQGGAKSRAQTAERRSALALEINVCEPLKLPKLPKLPNDFLDFGVSDFPVSMGKQFCYAQLAQFVRCVFPSVVGITEGSHLGSLSLRQSFIIKDLRA